MVQCLDDDYGACLPRNKTHYILGCPEFPSFSKQY